MLKAIDEDEDSEEEYSRLEVLIGGETKEISPPHLMISTHLKL